MVALHFHSHKSVKKLFHNLHIIFLNPLMGFKVICQLEKEPLKRLANVQEIAGNGTPQSLWILLKTMPDAGLKRRRLMLTRYLSKSNR